jgi:hypothetical protein
MKGKLWLISLAFCVIGIVGHPGTWSVLIDATYKLVFILGGTFAGTAFAYANLNEEDKPWD